MHQNGKQVDAQQHKQATEENESESLADRTVESDDESSDSVDSEQDSITSAPIGYGMFPKKIVHSLECQCFSKTKPYRDKSLR